MLSREEQARAAQPVELSDVANNYHNACITQRPDFTIIITNQK